LPGQPKIKVFPEMLPGNPFNLGEWSSLFANKQKACNFIWFQPNMPATDPLQTSHRRRSDPSLLQLLLQFMKIGSVAFGGPAAHAALMEQELVSRKKWLTHQLFLDFLGSVNLIPGPNSTQMTMLVGYKLRGFCPEC
jgi:hypothetical protein